MINKAQHEPTDSIGVHIVGSVPLPTTDEVFTTLTEKLPGRLRRNPNGETRHRQNFTTFQQDVFAAPPQVLRNLDPRAGGVVAKPRPSQAEVDEAVAAVRASGPPLTGYETNAVASYEKFKALKDAGRIEWGVKLQVSLPTPINTVVLLEGGWQEAMEPLYEENLLKALRSIEKEIPHEELCVQWDIAIEFAMLERLEFPFESLGVLERAVRLVDAVSADVEVGLHVRYGDIGHAHLFEPKDMAKLVEVAMAVKTRAKHDVAYVHMPVPIARTDVEYFQPLKNLELGDTQLYLGLLHVNDLEGTRKRIAAARQVVRSMEFGAASECGMGRTPHDHLNSILEISAAVSRPHQQQNAVGGT